MKKKIRLGKQTKDGYKYAIKGDMGLDLTTQIEEFVKEKEVKDLFKKEVNNLSKIIKGYKDKEKKNNLSYYRAVGERLKFLDKPSFKNIERWSAFRLIYEWLPDLLPYISKTRVARNHVGAMYYLGKVDVRDLPKATWNQWYEIAMFPKLFTKKKNYKKILALINKGELKGSLSEVIPRILKKS